MTAHCTMGWRDKLSWSPVPLGVSAGASPTGWSTAPAYAGARDTADVTAQDRRAVDLDVLERASYAPPTASSVRPVASTCSRLRRSLAGRRPAPLSAINAGVIDSRESLATVDTGLPTPKTGLNGLTRHLDGAYPDLLATSVCPGYVQMDMTDGSASRTPAQGADTPV